MSAPGSAPARRRTRIGGWAAVVLALVLVGVVGALLADASRWSERAPLDPESAGADGARAVARVLSAQGIDVRIARDRDSALRALADSDATLAVTDTGVLLDAHVDELAHRAAGVVLLEPRARDLRLLVNRSHPAGYAGTGLSPACTNPAAQRAGAIDAGRLFAAGPGVQGCYPSDDAFAMLVSEGVVAVDGAALLANDTVDRAGNAALALGLLGARDTLVWYVPGLGDADPAASAPTLGELTPAWVTPAIVLLLVAGAAAGVWRGRRFGPLVAENLPVTVRADETTRGRGRLYAHSRDAAYAAERLRAGTRERVRRTLGLGRGADALAIAHSAARRTGMDGARVRGILTGAPPADDRELLDLSHHLHDLEEAVRSATRPEGNPS